MAIDVAKYISIALVVVSMIIGAVTWATSQHADIRQWTAEQDFVTNNELMVLIRERYVPIEDVVRLQEQVKNLTEENNELKAKLEQLQSRRRR